MGGKVAEMERAWLRQAGKATHLWECIAKVARCGHIWEEGEDQDGGGDAEEQGQGCWPDTVS